MSRRTTALRRVRTVAVAAVTVAGAALLSACAPTTTALNYSPSDGVMVSVGATADEEFTQLRGLNLMVVAAEEGAPGNLLGALTNDTRQDATFTLSPQGTAPVTVDVAAGETVFFGGESGDPVLLDTVATSPGNSLPTQLEANGEVTEFLLPVLDGSLSHYADYVPDAAAVSAPTSSPSSTPDASATPAD